MLLGLAVMIGRFHVAPSGTKTVLAQLTDAAFGHNIAFFVVQFVTTLLLALAANTSFGGLPVLSSLLARDNYLPHAFALRADRQVYRYGVVVLAVAALVLIVGSQGNTQALVPFFAIGVFIGFTISQFGMVLHWKIERPPAWQWRAAINGVGAVLTAAATVIELITKFTRGGWIIFLMVALLVALFEAIHRSYARIGAVLHIGEVPPPPERKPSLVIVPVASVTRLTREAINAALSLGREVRAVTVVYTDEAGVANDQVRSLWQAWHPDVPLVVLESEHRSLSRPLVSYIREVDAEDPNDRVVVLIPEMQLPKPWQRLLLNNRGAILDRAVRHNTDAVICRLRFRIDPEPPADSS
jgi:hypothetical protein